MFFSLSAVELCFSSVSIFHYNTLVVTQENVYSAYERVQQYWALLCLTKFTHSPTYGVGMSRNQNKKYYLLTATFDSGLNVDCSEVENILFSVSDEILTERRREIRLLPRRPFYWNYQQKCKNRRLKLQQSYLSLCWSVQTLESMPVAHYCVFFCK